MLVATRDPLPRHGHAEPAVAAAPSHQASRIGRLMLVMQLAGSFLAIPVGLASGYSIYRANFSPETTCQTLRSNIVAMIDKQIDASTRRMLVRRDVEEFEKTCGSVDPDAGAAFKALLASDPPVAAVSTMQKVQPLALPAQEWKKPEHTQVTKASKEVKDAKDAKEPTREARVQASDPADDARWLGAVRHALTAHQAERASAEMTVKPLAPPPAAPALPPPTSIGASAAPAPVVRAEPDHPVPPASIPDGLATSSIASQTNWTDRIPFFGR